MKQHEREFVKLAPADKEKTMELVSSWECKGMHKGKETLLIRMIRGRFGSLSPELTERLDALSSDQLDDLGEALLDFASVADLETWLSRHHPH